MNRECQQQLIEVIGLLSIRGVGRGRYHRLVRHFGSPAKALAASPGELDKVPGISDVLAKEITAGFDIATVTKQVSEITERGWTALTSQSKDYPASLLTLPESEQPPLLFRLGHPLQEEERLIAIVGSRRPTEGGRRFAYNLAAALSKAGITVVSGMAEGIDTAAHKGALEAGGKTIAVWGSSLDVVYPKTHRKLADDIIAGGAVYSEYLPGTEPDKAHFPERNRIISGLSEGVVVVEAGQRSGALITAATALSQGRELFAVPGHPGAKMSEGTNELIKKGAKLLTSIDDIFEELPRLKGVVKGKEFTPLPELSDIEKRIVLLVTGGPQQVDQLSRQVELPVSELMEFLLALELKGIVQELSGKRFVLAEDYA